MRILLLVVLSLFLRADAALIEIEGGRKIYIDCQGAGSPTVVFISGRTDRSDIWKTVQGSVSQFTRTCSYDRPGTVTVVGEIVEPSRSTSMLQPTTPKNGVADLHALLTKANVPGPYVLVGHSYGGLIARLYASTYPKEIVGLVLVDTLTEFLYDALPKNNQSLWIRLNSNYSKDLDNYIVQERTDLESSFKEMRSSTPLHFIPTVVLTSDQTYDFKSLKEKGILPPDSPEDFGPTVFKAHLTGQEHLTRLLNAKHISQTHAGHYIQTERPQLVIDAIKEVINKLKQL